MDTWCTHNGVIHRLIPPGVKELNGKVERSHRIDMHYFYWRAPTHSLDAFNHSLQRWMVYYNSVRLHGGLGFITPLEKLTERRVILKTQKLESTLESIRLKFIQSQTILSLPNKQDWQIQGLERQLTQLLKKTA